MDAQKKLKMSDFNIRQTVVADANKRNTFIYPEALQMRDYEAGEDKWTKFFYANNVATGGLSGYVWQEFFHTVYRQNLEDSRQVVRFNVPQVYRKNIGDADITRFDFTWGSFSFSQAAVVMEPGKWYYFPKELATEINIALNSKVLDITELPGFTETPTGYYLNASKDEQPGEIDLEQFSV
jgi:hypothetical protein